MTELVPATGNKIEYAAALAKSNLLPKAYQGNPANLLFAIEFADALGMKPIHAITSVHVINGKPTASADLIGTMVRKAGHKLRVTGDDTYAEAQLIRADDPDFTFTARWDIAKAKAAGLNTPTWKQYPGAMLRARAITEVCRAGAPDALHGIQYSPEELEQARDLGERPTPSAGIDRLRNPKPEPETEADPVTGEVIDREQVPFAADIYPEWLARIDAATTRDELRAIYRQAPQQYHDIITAKVEELNA